jgi:hypothetical protein
MLTRVVCSMDETLFPSSEGEFRRDFSVREAQEMLETTSENKTSTLKSGLVEARKKNTFSFDAI